MISETLVQKISENPESRKQEIDLEFLHLGTFVRITVKLTGAKINISLIIFLNCPSKNYKYRTLLFLSELR